MSEFFTFADAGRDADMDGDLISPDALESIRKQSVGSIVRMYGEEIGTVIGFTGDGEQIIDLRSTDPEKAQRAAHFVARMAREGGFSVGISVTRMRVWTLSCIARYALRGDRTGLHWSVIWCALRGKPRRDVMECTVDDVSLVGPAHRVPSPKLEEIP